MLSRARSSAAPLLQQLRPAVAGTSSSYLRVAVPLRAWHGNQFTWPGGAWSSIFRTPGSVSGAAEPLEVPNGSDVFSQVAREFGIKDLKDTPFGDLSRASGAFLAFPKIDVVRNTDEYKLHAELPGMTKQDVKLRLRDGVLSLSGRTSSSSEDKDADGKVVRAERRIGEFHRSFTLPDDVDAGKIEASMRDGILTLRLPRLPEGQRPDDDAYSVPIQ